ncbi:MAG: MarR family winged helix-turn-helix transcriptional regulator [Actinomycetota bacterium]
MGAGTKAEASKKELAAEVWRPLVDFFFKTAKHRSRVLGRYGLTPGDARALASLEAGEGRPMGALAEEWACDASNATWMVDRLEERGLAERRSSPTDRRVKLVVLTPLGRKTRSAIMEGMYEPPPELLRLDRADLEALRDALARLPSLEEEQASTRS